jgi:voltage-gated potassium channel
MIFSREKIGFLISKEVFFFTLALTSIILFMFEMSSDLTIYQYMILGFVDVFIALLFFADFLYGLHTAPVKKIFWKERWWELIACIPVVHPVTQVLRGVGMIRLVRVVRVLARVKRLTDWADTLEYRMFSLGVVVTTLILLATSLFYSFEFPINPMVTGMFDSLWWAMSTVTTVGYGDIYPITIGGKIVGMFLMVLGLVTLTILVNTIVQHKKGVSINV